jgi:voltage-gated potassium channel
MVDPVGASALPSGAHKLHRGRLTAFQARHHRLWEGSMALLAAVYVVLAVRNDTVPGSVSVVLLTVFSAIFLMEFTVRCWDAPSRPAYAREHWLDIVSCIPVVGGLRVARLLRLLRLLPGVRHSLSALSGKNIGTRDTLRFIGVSIFLVWLGLAYALWDFEHGINSNIQTFGDALFWSLLTILTIGNGKPDGTLSPDARFVTGILAFIGIALVGVTSSRLTAMWLHQDVKESAILVELRHLRQEMESLRAHFNLPGDIGSPTHDDRHLARAVEKPQPSPEKDQVP